MTIRLDGPGEACVMAALLVGKVGCIQRESQGSSV